MARQPTAKIAKFEAGDEERLYVSRARAALPYLVRQAKAGTTITYGALAELLGMPNARNLNYVLGAVGQMLRHLGNREGLDIPPIQCLVVNKHTSEPSDGVDWFLEMTDRKAMSRAELKRVIDIQVTKSCLWDRWDWVLQKLGLQPIKVGVEHEMKEAGKGGGGGGEGAEHLAFKTWLAYHPEVLGISKRRAPGDLECCLSSADKLDIQFSSDKERVAVEVKSRISDRADILRGLFQCIKYKAVMEAEEKIRDRGIQCRVILALEGLLPSEHIMVKNILGIEVVENIVMVGQ